MSSLLSNVLSNILSNKLSNVLSNVFVVIKGGNIPKHSISGNTLHFYVEKIVFSSDEPEPSWLEPGLELNNFQLGSARLVTFSIQLGNFSIKARKLA